MKVYIPLPMDEPPERDAPLSGFDTHRALSQPPLPEQNTPLRLMGKSQTFTERQDQYTEAIRNNYPDTAFGEMVTERLFEYNGTNINPKNFRR